MADPLSADLRDALTREQARRRWLRPCTGVYLSMLGLTLVTFAIGVASLGGLTVSLSVLGLALIKGQLVGDYFMGLKAVQGPWRWVIAVWLLLPGALIGVAFTLARP
jgi:cytochrome c oxidase subunit IV